MLKTMHKTLYPQQELADRLRDALDNAGVSQADLARACNVTDQAVHNWLLTGRIGKQHLPMICHLTKKPFEYFLVGLKTWRRVAALALPFLFLTPHVDEAKAFSQSSVQPSVYYVKRLIEILIGFIRVLVKVSIGKTSASIQET